MVESIVEDKATVRLFPRIDNTKKDSKDKNKPAEKFNRFMRVP